MCDLAKNDMNAIQANGNIQLPLPLLPCSLNTMTWTWKRTTTASPSPTDRTASTAFARMLHKLFPARRETEECLVMVCPEADASGHLFVSAHIKKYNRIRGNLS